MQNKWGQINAGCNIFGYIQCFPERTSVFPLQQGKTINSLELSVWMTLFGTWALILKCEL